MEHRNIIAGGVVLLLIIIGMFVYAYLKKSELQNEVPTPPVVTEVSPYAYITDIQAKHFFKDGIHTLVGEINMPTPCDLLNWDTAVQESYPKTAIISFDVINNSEMCEQTVTPQRFKVTFSASEKATIRAMFEGRDVTLNLIPGGADESPDDFELFIKG